MTNVLLVTVDSLRADHLGCYGYNRETTPVLDDMAAGSNLFTNVFAHSGTTRTSFPAILTSSYALMYGGYERVSDRRTVVAEPLSEAGYQTAGFHSNLFLSADFGYDRGFDTFYDSKSDPSFTAKLRQFVKQNLDQDGLLFRFLKRSFEATEKHAGVEVGSAYVSADDITDMAIEWLDGVNPSEPTFLWTHYMDVHHPYLPPERHQRPIRDDPIDHRRATRLRRKMLEEPDEVTEEERQTLIDLYDAEIRFTDHEIGRLVSHTRERLEGDTVVVVTADHGEEFADHGGYSHNTVHDEGIHVPLIVDDGGDGGTYDDLVGLLDVAPTVLDYADASKPDSFLGHSVRRLVEGGDWPRDEVFGNWGGPEPGERQFFYRNREWKYLRTRTGEELYDLDADPGEHENVLAENPEVADRLRARVDEHEHEVEATHEDLGDVEMDEDVKERLAQLGYTDQ